MPRALYCITKCAVTRHQSFGFFQSLVVICTVFQRILPEKPFFGSAATIGQDDRKGDLAFPEIIARILAEILGIATVIQSVINELECQPEIEAIRA